MPLKLSFQEALQEIKNRVDVLSVISKYLPVKKSGNSYVALCPFHQDKSPSMHISPSKGIFKCFSCGASGDLFKFLTDYKKVSFSEVARDLAEELGIEIFTKEVAPELSREQALIFKMNELAKNFYSQALFKSEEGKPVLEYLHKTRNLTEESLQNFELGLSPRTKTSLLQHLQAQSDMGEDIKKPEFLIRSGLFIEDKNNNFVMDRFRGRLMVPIKDSQGRVVAFGARALDETAQPKYLNSPETPIYHKGHQLFGWNIAQNHTKNQKQVLLLEGYFDVIQAHQAGLQWAVGSLGTALTKEQATILYQSNLARSVLLGFDSDEAGQRALKSSLHVFQECKFSQKPDLRVLKIEGAKDIDEYLISNGQTAIMELLQAAPKAYEYSLNSVINKTDSSDENQRAEALNEVVDLICDVNDLIEREILAEQAARGLSFQKNTILELMRKKNRDYSPSAPSRFNSFTPQKTVRKKFAKREVDYVRLELELVSLLFLTSDKEIIEQIKKSPLKDATAILYRDKLLNMSLEEKQLLLNEPEKQTDFSKELLEFAQINKGSELTAFLETYQRRTSLMTKVLERWEKMPKQSTNPSSVE